MLSNNILQKVKSAAKTCKVLTVGSEIDIIMRIKGAYRKYGIIRKDYIRFLARAELCTT